MLHRYLGNYKDFVCTAGKCPDTCCSGWAIEIDEDALHRYASLAKAGDLPMKNRIDYEEACFCQNPNGDCAFLKENGLCEMILTHGEDILCDTCRLYPRHIEEFLGVREHTLSVSCPEVALQVLSMDSHFTDTEVMENDKEDESLYEDYDQELFDALVLCREEVLGIVRDSSVPFVEKCQTILAYMKEKQATLYDDEPDDFCEIPLFSRENFALLLELNPLKDDWVPSIQKAMYTLFGPSDKPFASTTTEGFIRAFESAHPSWKLQCDNLLYYFLYTYMCGAVYDDYVYAMAAQAVYNTCMIKLLWTSAYERKERPLTIKEQANILYTYSRELENDSENVIMLEQLLDEKW